MYNNFGNQKGNRHIQIQNKRRKNSYGGMWGSKINFFQNLGNNLFQGQNNYGWEQQGGWGQQQGGWGQQQGGWGQQQGGWGQNNNNMWGNNNYGNQLVGQMGLGVALFANRY
jgi:hypothetical protein